MPLVVDPDNETLASLMTAVPVGGHGVHMPNRVQPWLVNRPEEYVVVLGPHVDLQQALSMSDTMRLARPSTSVVLVRDVVDQLVLHDAMQAGIRDVVETSDIKAVNAAVDRAYQLYLALRGPGGDIHTGRVISVFSPKGGVGKTTVAVNLALALADKGARKVCLVDLDLAFGDVSITLQLFPTHTIEHAVGGEDSVDAEMLDLLVTRHPDSLLVLAAPGHPDVRERVTPALVSRILRGLRDQYDFIVVDLPSAFDEQTLAALDETDECVLVSTLDVPAMKNVKVALETLDVLSIAHGKRHLVVNRVDEAASLSADKVEGIIGMSVTTAIGTSVEIAAGTDAGEPVYSRNPRHPASTALRSLAERLTGGPAAPIVEEAPARPAKAGRRRLGRRA